MNVVFVLFDSLNRNALSCYNPNAAPTPAFDRLAQRGTRFDNHYAGSLPCMPARRDLLTGRLNFLHRSWGPVEPFDICFPEQLAEADIYTHLISDHYHYWEEGGCGYHNRYSSAEFVRGQERDPWKAMVQPPTERFREQYHAMLSNVPRRQPNMVNREFIREESDFPIVQCVDLACDFLNHNNGAQGWFLQVELFDPHEPFTSPARFRDRQTQYDGPILDWPLYDRLDLSNDEADELNANYQAIVALCDEQLGRLLDRFDEQNLWQTTALIVTTDHGFLLGDHGWWGKNRMPMYDPIVHIPLLACIPGIDHTAWPVCHHLTQCIDLTATFIDLFSTDQNNSEIMQGHSLLPIFKQDTAIRETALFGIFGGAMNITDGRFVYFHYPTDTSQQLHEYTLMPVHPASYFSREEFAGAQWVKDQPYANGFPVMKLPALDNAKRPPMQGGALDDANSVLFDLETDANQLSPIQDTARQRHMIEQLAKAMHSAQAPPELFRRFSIDRFAN